MAAARETVGLETGRRLRGTRAGRETVGLDGRVSRVCMGAGALGVQLYVGIGNTLKISYDYVQGLSEIEPLFHTPGLTAALLQRPMRSQAQQR